MRKLNSLLAILFVMSITTGCFEDPGSDILLDASFVSLAVDSQQSSEDEGTGEIVVEISQAQSSATTVSFEITTSNAVNGVDFTITGTSVDIPAGEYSTVIPYTITDNTVFEANPRSFTVTITSVSGGIAVDGVSAITVAILNNDCPANTSVWFGAVTVDDVGFSSSEGSGAANENGDCDILVVTGDYVGAVASVVWEFTPSSAGATSGTVVANRQPYDCCTGQNYEYEASGTYDEATGIILADYQFYTGGSPWFTGTTQIDAQP